LLEGLEISEIRFKEVEHENLVFRIDAQYFKKQYLLEDNLVSKMHPKNLGDFSFITEIKHITAKNARGWFANDIDADRIAKWVDDNNKRSSLVANDIILSTRGTVGLCAIVGEEILPANIDQDVARIALDATACNPNFLLTYINSSFGQDWLVRNQTGMVQQGIALWRVKQMPIPICSMKFQEHISKTIDASKSLKNKSKDSYAQAEQTLLEAVGLAGFKPSTQNTNIKTFVQSFGTSGRLDAEYYQPKYDYLENVFNQFERIKLQDLVNYPISSGITPKAGGDDYTDAENGVPFVRAVDLQNGLVSIDNFNYIKPEIHTGILKRTQLKQNDFLFSIAGTVGRCAIFEHTFEANINQAVAILRFRDERVNPYYLMVFFNSYIGKEFVEKYSRQGLQTNLNLSEVGDLSIPIIDLVTQAKISQLVQQSFSLKAESQRLLDLAKRAVEIAIETDERAAMVYLESQT
jgi:restriction endonuclease S subunit